MSPLLDWLRDVLGTPWILGRKNLDMTRTSIEARRCECATLGESCEYFCLQPAHAYNRSAA